MIQSLVRLTIILVFYLTGNVTAQSSLSKLDKVLIQKFNHSNQEIFSCFVVLHQKPIFREDLNRLNKNEKAQSVYNKLTETAYASQNNIIEYFKTRNIPFRSFYIVNGLSFNANKEQILEISAMPEVQFIYDDSYQQVLHYFEDSDENLSRQVDPEWGIRKIKADSVWLLGIKGSGVVVGGQDTGYAWDVSPLKNKYRGLTENGVNHDYNWHDAIREPNQLNGADTINPCGYGIKVPCDDNNHGTHTMGTMVGEDDENKIGVAPESSWMACRNMERGWGKPSTYIECFEWFLAPWDLEGKNPNPSLAPHVINNSWGCPNEEGCNTSNWAVMDAAVQNLRLSGVVVVVSAGNSGSNCETVNTPAAQFAASFSVGSTRQTDEISGFSSRGPVTVDGSNRLKPDVSAPGQGVRSVIRDGQYRNFSGTSMAGPHVAGAVALIISANPALAGKVDVIEDILKRSAEPLKSTQDCGQFPGNQSPNAVFGYGRIDVLRAVKLALRYSETCLLNESVEINTQQEADNFYEKYYGCKVVNGSLKISGDDIFTLEGFKNIEEIRDTLHIAGNPSLVNLGGLNKLKSVNALEISNNNILVDLSGLSSLNKVFELLQINSNNNLITLTGPKPEFSKSIKVNIAGNQELGDLELLSRLDSCQNILISNNPKINTLSALDSLAVVFGEMEISGTSIPDLIGLNSLNFIGGKLTIASNSSLLNLTGMFKLYNLYELSISKNPILRDLSGLEEIIYVANDLNISGNDGLKNILGLKKLEWIGGALVLSKNIQLSDTLTFPVLNEMNALIVEENPLLIAIGREDDNYQIKDKLVLKNNPNLMFCESQPVCQFIVLNPRDKAEISGNASTCVDVNTLFIACWASTSSTSLQDSKIWPNPATDKIYITNHNGFLEYNLFDLMGKSYYLPYQNREWDITGLQPGFYILQIHSGNSMRSYRFCKI